MALVVIILQDSDDGETVDVSIRSQFSDEERKEMSSEAMNLAAEIMALIDEEAESVH